MEQQSIYRPLPQEVREALAIEFAILRSRLLNGDGYSPAMGRRMKRFWER